MIQNDRIAELSTRIKNGIYNVKSRKKIINAPPSESGEHEKKEFINKKYIVLFEKELVAHLHSCMNSEINGQEDLLINYCPRENSYQKT